MTWRKRPKWGLKYPKMTLERGQNAARFFRLLAVRVIARISVQKFMKDIKEISRNRET